MNYINEELLEKAEMLKNKTDAKTAYNFLVDIIKLELKQAKRSAEK